MTATQRAEYIIAHGIHAYDAMMQREFDKSHVATVNGHSIRRVQSERFGTLYMVGDTNMAFGNVDKASDYARTVDA